MIIVKLISGLGNQLFQYSFARRIALERNIPMKLDISFYETQNLRSYKLHHFNIPVATASAEEVDRFHKRDWFWMVRKGWYGMQRTLPYYKKRIVSEKEIYRYDPNMLKTNTHTYFDGYWQHYKYHLAFDEVIRSELAIRQEYLLEEDALVREIRDQKYSVSVHIRRGDYITDPEASEQFGSLPMDYYYQAINQIKEIVPAPTLYVFSDDISWVKEYVDFSCTTRYVELADPSQDYIELFLMSQCQHHIIANSTFSWWGAYLNPNKHKKVIAPRQWTKQAVLNKKIEIQKPGWIKI